MKHLYRNYVKQGARFPVEMWSHHESTKELWPRTTNSCESFHSHLNEQMIKSIQFFKIVSKIELYSIDTELSRARIRAGKGLDNRSNSKRYRRALSAQRGMRAFLDISDSFEERLKYLHSQYQITLFMDREFVENYEPDVEAEQEQDDD